MKTSLVVVMVSSFLFSTEDPQEMLNKQYNAYTTTQKINPSGVRKYRNRITNTDLPLPKSARMFIDTNIDWELYAESAFGEKTWHALSERQKNNFKSLFRKVHLKKYGKYLSPDTRFSVEFVGPTKYKTFKGHNFAKVSTTLLSVSHNVEFDVDFIFHKNKNRWALCDVYVDGVSKSKNYRSQINRIYKKDGYTGVIEAFHRALDKS